VEIFFELSAPNGFVGIFYSQTPTDCLIGNIVRSNSSNQLAEIFIPEMNVSFIGQSFYYGFTCGANLPHGFVDLTSNIYYTMCCIDINGCLNASLVQIQIPSNSIINTVPLSLSQQVVYGYYWLPSPPIQDIFIKNQN